MAKEVPVSRPAAEMVPCFCKWPVLKCPVTANTRRAYEDAIRQFLDWAGCAGVDFNPTASKTESLAVFSPERIPKQLDAAMSFNRRKTCRSRSF
jgi:hypothetical protein